MQLKSKQTLVSVACSTVAAAAVLWLVTNINVSIAAPSSPVLPVVKYVQEDASGHKFSIMTWVDGNVKCTSISAYSSGTPSVALSCVKIKL